MKRLTRIVTIILITVGFILTFNSISHSKQVLKLKTVQIQDTQLKLNVLENKYDKAVKDKTTTEQQLQQLEKDKQDLTNQLQAKLDQQNKNVVYAAPAPTSDNDAKMFIYMHESGNDPTRWNSSGCLGLGQACPASKLLAVCPNMDYACEDAWFTNYMINRYGTWENARNVWLSQNWW